MVLNAFLTLTSGFEGCEKKLEIDFVDNGPDSDLRKIERSVWVHILSKAQCEIISEAKNEHFSSYLLSESSMFVFPHKVILKTCGTTSLLHVIPPLLAAAKELGSEPEFLSFSRSNFMFPDEQPYPHKSFTTEVNYLNSFFDGSAYILGPLNGPRWHLYIADFQSPRTSDQTLEVIMFNLDPEVMKLFYQQSDEESKVSEKPYDGDTATKLSGIDKLIPNSTIDSFLFNPCGYSCNGINEESYFTVHITPEPECSFVSFETNLNLVSYTKLVEAVLNMFKPASWCVSIFVDEDSMASDAVAGIDWKFANYVLTDHTKHTFEGYNVAVGNFEAEVQPDRPYFGDFARRLAHVTDGKDAKDAKSAEIDSQRDITALPANSQSVVAPSRLMLPWKVSKMLQVEQLLNVIRHALGKQFDVQEVPKVVLETGDTVAGITGVSREGIPSPRASGSLSRMKDSMEDVVQFLVSRQDYDQDLEDAFYIVDIAELAKKFLLWCSLFPKIKPYYDVKCNDNKGLLAVLSTLGCGFKCSSSNDIEMLLSLGVAAENLHFANPWKQNSHIKFAKSQNVAYLSFDNLTEIIKIKKHYADANLVMIVAAPVPHDTNTPWASVPRRQRYGVRMNEAMKLLEHATASGLKVVGVTLHFGGVDCPDEVYLSALDAIHKLFDQAKENDIELEILNIDSGFPVSSISSSSPLTGFAADICLKLDELFPPPIQIFAEPSKFLIESSYTLVTNVIARKKMLPMSPSSAGNVQLGENVEGFQESPQYSEVVDSPTSRALSGDIADVFLSTLDPGTPTDNYSCVNQNQKKGRETQLGKNGVGKEQFLYYINDGTYGSFNCLFYQTDVELEPLTLRDGDKARYQCTVFGPTCDSTDCVLEKAFLPELQVGDWMYFRNMGAYTVSHASNFNGFGPPKACYVILT